MSVVTTADESLEFAKEAIDSAIQHLSKIVVEKCWGYKDFTKEYSAILRNSMTDLISMLSRLENGEENDD